jgi:hypothetical protein
MSKSVAFEAQRKLFKYLNDHALLLPYTDVDEYYEALEDLF